MFVYLIINLILTAIIFFSLVCIVGYLARFDKMRKALSKHTSHAFVFTDAEGLPQIVLDTERGLPMIFSSEAEAAASTTEEMKELLDSGSVKLCPIDVIVRSADNK